MKKLMLCFILSILFINSYSQDTICTMVRPYEVIEFNYQNSEIISRYDSKKPAIITIGHQEVLCLHLYDEKKRFRKVITTYDDGERTVQILESKDHVYYSPVGAVSIEVRRSTLFAKRNR